MPVYVQPVGDWSKAHKSCSILSFSEGDFDIKILGRPTMKPIRYLAPYKT